MVAQALAQAPPTNIINKTILLLEIARIIVSLAATTAAGKISYKIDMSLFDLFLLELLKEFIRRVHIANTVLFESLSKFMLSGFF